MNEGVVNVLVGPLCRFTDSPPLLGARVPAFGDVRLFWNEAVYENLPQLCNTFWLCFLHPSRSSIWAMMRSPVMGAVDIIYRSFKVFI